MCRPVCHRTTAHAQSIAASGHWLPACQTGASGSLPNMGLVGWFVSCRNQLGWVMMAAL
jgi:hypothetical protein